jgi:hypothetical protein
MTADELKARLQASRSGGDAVAAIEKLGFKLEFVADNVISAGAPVSVSQIAMLWMGMPNKHDRKRTSQLFEILAQAGLVQTIDEQGEQWEPVSTL